MHELMGKKSYEISKNQSYHDWPMHYDPLLPETSEGPDGNPLPLDTGMKVLENGDISFRIYAPKVQSIHIGSGRAKNRIELELTKDADGYFCGIIPFSHDFLGPHSLDFFIDGTCFLYPYAPISWHRNRPVNYIDMADEQTPYVQITDVPHGAVSRELYWSETMGRYQRCLVYTPAGYMKNTESYPVLYLQHGMTENEVTWEYNGRVSAILDNLIAQGKCKPMIVVMNDGMVALPEDGPGSAFYPMLVKDCMPYIENTYRVKTGAKNTALAGLSMGSMQATYIGLLHPELFSYLGIFSGFMRGRFVPGNKHLDALKDSDAFVKNYPVFFRSCGDLDSMVRIFYEDDMICAESGIDKLPNYHRVVYEGQHHEFGAWRRALHDFVQLIFQ